ncbi:phosphoribosyltransferase [Streptomyces sp. ST2-7A]|uniref:phosphoribosyltransferase n=1 Tax=Streptomyces sp. ST2-7A TaxID=2907214 RepID=UPI001F37BD5D|nr:phosphoribosyltransferase family protein [Streptomyces sp. ST2-7A]MCE7082816.1 phosphoribosyltransferase [Streptomyces sp. ST2-7A]
MPETLTVPTPFTARVVERLGVGPAGRPERVIHSLDGLEASVRPSDLTAVGGELWQCVRQEIPAVGNGVDFVLGLDAGGILPTVALTGAAGLPYKIAWKLDLPLKGRVRFTEPHANRTDVFVYGISAGQRILLVDDEITTGRTLADLTVRLREAGALPLGAACLVEDTEQEGRSRLADLDLPLVCLTRLGDSR